MPGVIVQPPAKVPTKRVLQDSTNSRRNEQASPSKKRKIGNDATPKFKTPAKRGPNGKHLGSSQPKSQFEEEVLEKLTQDIDALKHKNSEKDQHWARPPLDDFNEKTDDLCFQSIECEEGTLHGGKTTVRLFGVTETGHSVLLLSLIHI